MLNGGGADTCTHYLRIGMDGGFFENMSIMIAEFGSRVGAHCLLRWNLEIAIWITLFFLGGALLRRAADVVAMFSCCRVRLCVDNHACIGVCVAGCFGCSKR